MHRSEPACPEPTHPGQLQHVLWACGLLWLAPVVDCQRNQRLHLRLTAKVTPVQRPCRGAGQAQRAAAQVGGAGNNRPKGSDEGCRLKTAEPTFVACELGKCKLGCDSLLPPSSVLDHAPPPPLLLARAAAAGTACSPSHGSLSSAAGGSSACAASVHSPRSCQARMAACVMQPAAATPTQLCPVVVSLAPVHLKPSHRPQHVLRRGGKARVDKTTGQVSTPQQVTSTSQ